MPLSLARQKEMLGTTFEALNARLHQERDNYGRLRYAMGILSDAQEAVARGMDEEAKQAINAAKWAIDMVAMELR